MIKKLYLSSKGPNDSSNVLFYPSDHITMHKNHGDILVTSIQATLNQLSPPKRLNFDLSIQVLLKSTFHSS